MTVIKVGGSLYPLPDLAQRLKAIFDSIDGEILMVPGGGHFADAVRELQLDDETAHWTAVRAMDQAGAFLRTMTARPVLAVEPFLRANDTLPHSWDVTSDSIALHAATVFGAADLVLLKSCEVAADWNVAAANGQVDRHFPRLAATTSIRIRAVNLRSEHAMGSGPTA